MVWNLHHEHKKVLYVLNGPNSFFGISIYYFCWSFVVLQQSCFIKGAMRSWGITAKGKLRKVKKRLLVIQKIFSLVAMASEDYDDVEFADMVDFSLVRYNNPSMVEKHEKVGKSNF